jgi:hypothetical protein
MKINEEKKYKNYNLYTYQYYKSKFTFIGVWIDCKYWLIRIDNILSLPLKKMQIVCMDDIELQYLNSCDFDLIKGLYPILDEEFLSNENE